MAIYGFVCEGCGPFDVRRPASEASRRTGCPTCGHDARRVYSAPSVVRTPAPIRAALAAEEKSAHQPAVTSEKTGRRLHHRHGAPPPWAMGHT
ncbi:MAG: zinc ribbon domain-containing protein [Mycetocola sp.]